MAEAAGCLHVRNVIMNASISPTLFAGLRQAAEAHVGNCADCWEFFRAEKARLNALVHDNRPDRAVVATT
ncbi:MAG: hypothetical protein A3J48_01635 [Candidatus Doudnabacteria bacterium RIFCSPHIGHO2_02_FULL_46_11]|uniref:Zinc-finger domain-containing protein n=1 Tax=Candidatus Doudnabacteria bacterium RIFCSPHIGHO2_02_FULL_46_11 TaxID=1817832 RepID=A0A1F5PA56_9BACT|nr:MAG: hypothetical protein A3J48_01635 [Candidatus Doudnabacteria bacterium RIFCSPHIGHO2_02_FULL_46_11]